MREESLRSLVVALRELLAAAPDADAFLHDWRRELIARPMGRRSLPVVASLHGLWRFAARQTRALVEGVAALATELDWRQTYGKADFGARFLENYGFNEWIGQRGAFMSDGIACGVLLLGPDTEYPELYLPLAGHAFWRLAESDWRVRPDGVDRPRGMINPFPVERAAREQGSTYLEAESSLAAVPFYRDNGYRVQERGEHVLRNGQRMTGYQARHSHH